MKVVVFRGRMVFSMFLEEKELVEHSLALVLQTPGMSQEKMESGFLPGS